MSNSKTSIADMFPNALKQLEKITELGARKHGADSWKDLKNSSLEHKANVASINRHVAAYSMEMYYEPEGEVDHRANAAWRLLASLERDYGIHKTLDLDEMIKDYNYNPYEDVQPF